MKFLLFLVHFKRKLVSLTFVQICTIMYKYYIKKWGENYIMTQVMKASEVRQQWSQLLNRVFRGQTRVVVEKSGIPVAAVISAEDLDYLTKLEKQRAERFKVLDEISVAFKDVSSDKLFSEVTSAVKEVRKERRKK